MINLGFDFERRLEAMLKNNMAAQSVKPLTLGGVTGASGGSGGPIGGVMGQLPQSFITYDLTEAALDTPTLPASGISLVTNLNKIRYDISELDNRLVVVESLSGGSGASSFLDLTDTPNVYTGYGGLVVTVNSSETGLEFTSVSGGTGSGDMSKSTYDPDNDGIISIENGGTGQSTQQAALHAITGVTPDTWTGMTLTYDQGLDTLSFQLPTDVAAVHVIPNGFGSANVKGTLYGTPDFSDYFLIEDILDSSHVKKVGYYTLKTDILNSISISGGATNFLDLTDTPNSYTGLAGSVVSINPTEDGLEFTTISGSSGVDSFLELSDTPDTYIGLGGKVVSVNETEDGLEFTTISVSGGTNNFIDLLDTPATYTGNANKLVAVNSGESALEFIDTLSYLTDAPANGNLYGRKDSVWAVISGSISVTDSDTIDLTLAGSDLSAQLKDSGATPGSYLLSNITVDQYGRVTSVSGGTDTFLNLSDTPNVYLGSSGKFVVVSSGETGLEFINTPSYLIDAPIDGSLYGRKDSEWVTISGGAFVAHHTAHELGGIDEISVSGLLGVLGTRQDADKIQGINVDPTPPNDTSVATYDSASQTIKWVYPQTGGSNAEGPGIDISVSGDVTTIGIGGDSILVYHLDGSPVTEYAATDAGLDLATSETSNGDLIVTPVHTFTADHTFGPCEYNLENSIFTGQITVVDWTQLDLIHIDRTANDANNIIGILGPTSGTARVFDAYIHVIQSGAGAGYAIKMLGGNIITKTGDFYGTTAGILWEGNGQLTSYNDIHLSTVPFVGTTITGTHTFDSDYQGWAQDSLGWTSNGHVTITSSIDTTTYHGSPASINVYQPGTGVTYNIYTGPVLFYKDFELTVHTGDTVSLWAKCDTSYNGERVYIKVVYTDGSTLILDNDPNTSFNWTQFTLTVPAGDDGKVTSRVYFGNYYDGWDLAYTSNWWFDDVSVFGKTDSFGPNVVLNGGTFSAAPSGTPVWSDRSVWDVEVYPERHTNDSDTATGIHHSLGTGATQAATGNHTHTQLHDAITVTDSSTIDLTLTGQALSGAVIPGGIKLDDLGTPDDTLDLNASTTRHGLLPKLSGVTTDALKGDGSWGTVAGGSITVEEVDGTPTVGTVNKIKVPNGTLLDDGGGVVTLDFGSAAMDGNAIHDNTAGEIAAITEKTTPVSADLILIEDSADSNSKKKVQLGNLPGGGLDYILLKDKKSQNTNGGTFTAAQWQIRDINTESVDTGNICSISSNEITLSSGTYRCRISSPVYAVGRHMLRLYNVTASAVLQDTNSEDIYGTSMYVISNDDAVNRSEIIARFTLASQTVIRLEHRCVRTLATLGLGVATNLGPETYTIAEFWRE